MANIQRVSEEVSKEAGSAATKGLARGNVDRWQPVEVEKEPGYASRGYRRSANLQRAIDDRAPYLRGGVASQTETSPREFTDARPRYRGRSSAGVWRRL